IRYGFMPNKLRYCGGDDNRTLLEYGLAQEVDHDLERILRKFTGALPYLTLIARANGIADPFDDRVVEAYWLRNDLPRTFDARQATGCRCTGAGCARSSIRDKSPAFAATPTTILRLRIRRCEVGCRVSGKGKCSAGPHPNPLPRGEGWGEGVPGRRIDHDARS